MSEDISHFPAVGMDGSELMLQTGMQHYQDLPVACAWRRSLPIASGQLPAVLAECSLSAMSDLEDVLEEFYAGFMPSGQLASE